MNDSRVYPSEAIMETCEYLGIDSQKFMRMLELTHLRRQFEVVAERRIRLIEELGEDIKRPLFEFPVHRLSVLGRFSACDEEWNRLRTRIRSLAEGGPT